MAVIVMVAPVSFEIVLEIAPLEELGEYVIVVLVPVDIFATDDIPVIGYFEYLDFSLD